MTVCRLAVLLTVTCLVAGFVLIAMAKGVAFALVVAGLVGIIWYAGWSSIAPDREGQRRAR